MSSSPLHLGLTPWIGDFAGAAAEIGAQAERAEAMGFDSIWLPESHFSGATSNPAP